MTTSTETRPVAAEADRADAVLAAGGDAVAFERLYRRHLGRVYSLVRRMLGGDHVDEVTQDVFVRAWQKIGLFRGESAFGTWLHRLAINVVLARRSELGKARDRFLDDETALDRISSRPVTVDARVDFEAALSRLPDGARQVFVLHDVEGYKHEEIAELLQVTAGTSKSQLHRARMVLRQYLT